MLCCYFAYFMCTNACILSCLYKYTLVGIGTYLNILDYLDIGKPMQVQLCDTNIRRSTSNVTALGRQEQKCNQRGRE